AIGAALLVYHRLPGGVPAFVLAAVVILAGLIGLLVQYNREKQRPPAEELPTPTELHVYRQASCRVEMALLNRLARAAQALHDRAREKGWDPDWPVYERHLDLAQQQHRDGQLEAAFAEYCRAMRPLMEALARNRSKEEVLLHVWDKEQEE